MPLTNQTIALPWFASDVEYHNMTRALDYDHNKKHLSYTEWAYLFTLTEEHIRVILDIVPIPVPIDLDKYRKWVQSNEGCRADFESLRKYAEEHKHDLYKDVGGLESLLPRTLFDPS